MLLEGMSLRQTHLEIKRAGINPPRVTFGKTILLKVFVAASLPMF
jgi:hypothetical protein